ncbi:ABC transporter permease [Litoribacter populi]|uniref:ABC transporter permease n=1 Tax=Litoribacter populi TaxID=2598460 RepID=UPI00117F3924|nr:ABC transporter permease [Litoribacter populi]
MLKNYFIIGYRNILRSKLRTLVHVLGLSLGVAVCLLVFHVVWYENSFDKFHEDGDRIYQVMTHTHYQEESWLNGGVPFPMAGVIEDEIPDVETKTHFYQLEGVRVHLEEDKGIYKERPTVMTDNQHFRIFQRQWLAGNPSTALNEPGQVVLTQAAAELYFQGLPPPEVLGKELTYYFLDTVQVTVAGVVEDYTGNTDFIFTDFLSIQNARKENGEDFYAVDNWQSVNSSSQLFVKLHADTNLEHVNEKLGAIPDKYMEKSEKGFTEFSLLPLVELHFHENFDRPAANKSVLQGLILVGLFILVLACLNFINLETAQSFVRFKEVGIRKTLGGSRSQLIFQFLAETAIIVILAIAGGLVFSDLLVRGLQDLLPDGFVINYLAPEGVAFLVAMGMLLTLFAGIMPAIMLSALQAQKVLKGDFKQINGFSWTYFLQKNLTVIQFTLSIGFIISVLVVSSQIQYMMNKELGFDKEQVMYIRLPFLSDSSQRETFKHVISQQAGVRNTSLGSDILASSSLWTSSVEVTTPTEKKEISVQVKMIDSRFLDVYQVKPKAGRNVRDASNEILINEKFVERLGFDNARDAIGYSLDFNQAEREVVGVVPDFHSRTLREEIRPLILQPAQRNATLLSVKMEANTDLKQAKEDFGLIYQAHFPFEDGEFKFFDETIANFYKSDFRVMKVLGLATLIALVISFLGLFALTSFTIAQRTKEISIRKVLGAGTMEILVSLSKEYVVLMAVAFGLAAIPTWYLLNNWLKEFYFKINMPYDLYFLAGIAALFACLAIVGLHSYKAMQKNPADVLKSE